MSDDSLVTVPFVDLRAQYETIKSEIDDAIANVIKTSAFVRGPYVAAFEDEFAKAIGVDHCVSCANGTDALYISMHALGVNPGDEVIAPAHSWISTTETITQAGGKVVFVDTEPDTYLIDPDKIESKITDRTVGIIPVHLFGQPAEMDTIMAVAKKYNLWVIEDCAQAHLAQFDGRRVGTFGDVATFSFYPGKNLGAMGDAGAAVTSDGRIARRMARFARHGGITKGMHEIEGINSRMDGLQAAILSVKLRYLPAWTQRRQYNARLYDDKLSVIQSVKRPVIARDRNHVYHLYVIRHESRDELAEYLKTHGVSTVVNYPTALPFLQAYSHLGARAADFPNAHRNQSRILSLPMYAELTEAQIDRVVSLIATYVDLAD